MAPAVPRLRILSVGGNAVSAFLSWRLQATNACDVTLVWKSGYDNVAQYGISMKSALYGNERFKPYAVVKAPEDAAASAKQPFDYVLLCVKALPDIYDIANIIECVVSPQHTCILMNTTHSLGVESYLEQRFPTNVVLSLVSGAEITQLGASEFEHKGATDVWVGPANKNPAIPAQIQADMSEALAMTLSSGQVDCKVSPNIRQQQYERVIGPIAFHPASVAFETPNHTELLEKVGVKELVTGVIDELLELAKSHGCTFPADFRETTIRKMTQPQDTHSTMYLDFETRRPMEVETYLGSPLKLALENNVAVPRIETLYAILHHLNLVNLRTKPPASVAPSPSNGVALPPRLSSAPMPRGPPGPGMNGNGPMMNGNGPMKGGPRPGSRAPSVNGAPPMMRRGPPPNGYPSRPVNGNGYPPGPGQRRPSFEDNSNLEEFSHLMLYDNMADDGGNGRYENGSVTSAELALKERELLIRQKELELQQQQQEMYMRRGGPRRPPPAPASHAGGFDEDDDEDDYFDPMATRGPATIDPDNFDMMSVTSRRNRKIPSASQIRKNPEMGFGPGGGRSRNPFGRGSAGANKNRTSARLMQEIPGLHDPLMNNALMGYSSNRYGNVDRGELGQQSRTNSLTAARLDELQGGSYGAYPPMNRRISHSPGNPLSPAPRPVGRPSPPNGYAPNGMPTNGGPSPPNLRQPAPRHPPGHGNAVAPHQVEQHAGVSLYPPNKRAQTRSLTGSASASAGSGSSGASAQLDSTENSAQSSQSSLGPRPPIGVR